MTSGIKIGRIVGVLMLVHLAAGLIVPYIVLQPLTRAPAAFLEVAAGMAFQVRLQLTLLMVGALVPLGIAIPAWPLVRHRSQALGLWCLALAAVNLTLQLVENAHWLSMLSLSQAYAAAGPADAATFQSLGLVVRAAWKWDHYAHLLVAVGWMFAFYLLLARAALVPRVLAVSGMVAALLQVSGITLPVFLGERVPNAQFLGMTLGLAHLALALWLMVRGFRDAGGAGAPRHAHDG